MMHLLNKMYHKIPVITKYLDLNRKPNALTIATT